MDNLRISAGVGEPWHRVVDIGIWKEEGGKFYAVQEDLPLAECREADPTHPSLSISFEAAQALMDNLWTCGIRPTEGTGSAGALAATQKHLEDMRKLVFEMYSFLVTASGKQGG